MFGRTHRTQNMINSPVGPDTTREKMVWAGIVRMVRIFQFQWPDNLRDRMSTTGWFRRREYDIESADFDRFLRNFNRPSFDFSWNLVLYTQAFNYFLNETQPNYIEIFVMENLPARPSQSKDNHRSMNDKNNAGTMRKIMILRLSSLSLHRKKTTTRKLGAYKNASTSSFRRSVIKNWWFEFFSVLCNSDNDDHSLQHSHLDVRDRVLCRLFIGSFLVRRTMASFQLQSLCL